MESIELIFSTIIVLLWYYYGTTMVLLWYYYGNSLYRICTTDVYKNLILHSLIKSTEVIGFGNLRPQIESNKKTLIKEQCSQTHSPESTA